MSVTAFTGTKRLKSGDLPGVTAAAKQSMERSEAVLVFDDATGETVDLDFREPEGGAEPVRHTGRPKLGVIPREVTLLPRHWEWLNEQPGGASAALRRLVEQARREGAGRDRIRRAQNAAYRFMSSMAGDEPGFEEALRALFAGDAERFDACVSRWPEDVRAYATTLAAAALRRGDY